MYQRASSASIIGILSPSPSTFPIPLPYCAGNHPLSLECQSQGMTKKCKKLAKNMKINVID